MSIESDAGLPEGRMAYLQSLVDISRNNGYKIDDNVLATLKKDDLVALDDLLLQEMEIARKEGDIATAKAVGIGVGLRGRIEMLLGGYDAHYTQWNAAADTSDNRYQEAVSFHPEQEVDSLRSKTLESTFGDFAESGIVAGDRDIEPGINTWGVIVVDANSSINDNVNFIETHIDSARKLRDQLIQRLRTEAQNLSRNFDFNLLPLHKYEVADAVKNSETLPSVDDYIAQAQALAGVLNSNVDRLIPSHLMDHPSIIVGWGGTPYFSFSYSNYSIYVDLKTPPDETAVLVENIVHADGPQNATRYASYVGRGNVSPDSIASYNITLACTKNSYPDRFLVSHGNDFIPPSAESEGYFVVKGTASRDEIEKYIQRHMTEAVRFYEAANQKAAVG